MDCKLKKFNTAQLDKCKVCKHASGNVNHPQRMGFCGLHGVRIEDPAKQRPAPRQEPSPIIQPSSDLQLPSKLQMGKNLASSAGRFVKSGMKIRSDADAAKCMLTCKACEFFIHDSQRCSKCGCFANLKVRVASDHCPIGKW